MGYIFISYSRADKTRAIMLAGVLATRGYDVWFDQALTRGESFRDEITRKLDEADCVIALWTQRSLQSQWVMAEAQRAAEQNKLISVTIQDLIAPSTLPPHASMPVNLGRPFSSDMDSVLRLLESRNIGRVDESGLSADARRARSVFLRLYRINRSIVLPLMLGVVGVILSFALAPGLIVAATQWPIWVRGFLAAIALIVPLRLALRYARDLQHLGSLEGVTPQTFKEVPIIVRTPKREAKAEGEISGSFIFLFEPSGELTVNNVRGELGHSYQIHQGTNLTYNLMEAKDPLAVLDGNILVIAVWGPEAARNSRLVDLAEEAARRGQLISLKANGPLPIGFGQTHVFEYEDFSEPIRAQAASDQLRAAMRAFLEKRQQSPAAAPRATGAPSKVPLTTQIMLFGLFAIPILSTLAITPTAYDLLASLAQPERSTILSLLSLQTPISIGVALAAIGVAFAHQMQFNAPLAAKALKQAFKRGDLYVRLVLNLYALLAYGVCGVAVLYVAASYWFELGMFAELGHAAPWSQDTTLRPLVLGVLGVVGIGYLYVYWQLLVVLFRVTRKLLRRPPPTTNTAA